MEANQQRPTGMVAFTIIWPGQIVSLLGTAMSQLGLTLWAYEVTGKATPLAGERRASRWARLPLKKGEANHV